MSQKKIKSLTERLLSNVRAQLRAGMDKVKWLKKCEDKARARRKKKAKEENDEERDDRFDWTSPDRIEYVPLIKRRKKR